MDFQRRSERLNGVLFLDALGEDIPEGGSDISEKARWPYRFALESLGPATSRRDLDAGEGEKGCVFGEDHRGRAGCYHELTGKWQREFCGRSVSGWEANEAV